MCPNLHSHFQSHQFGQIPFRHLENPLFIGYWFIKILILFILPLILKNSSLEELPGLFFQIINFLIKGVPGIILSS